MLGIVFLCKCEKITITCKFCNWIVASANIFAPSRCRVTWLGGLIKTSGNPSDPTFWPYEDA